MVSAGVIKELLTISMAVAFFADDLTWNNLVGAGLVIVAVLYYAYHKSAVVSRTAADQVHIPVCLYHCTHDWSQHKQHSK